ncbi:MAG: tetratricopeptide repeat protein [Planctomycetaceae bacterium]|nr:tetratricopeptide repeat protein [Planctomycetaceae bacterium]
MVRKRRWRLVLLCTLAGGAASVWYAWQVWQRRDLDHRIDLALSALREEDSLDVVHDTIAQLVGRPDWHSELRLLEGGVLLRGGDPSAALQAFDSVRNDGRLRVSLFLMGGEALYRLGRLADAESIFLNLAQEHPDESKVHRWLATIYHDFGSIDSSMAELERLAQLRPGDFLAYRLMGRTYAGDYRRFDEAAVQYRLALERNPPEPDRSDIIREFAQCLVLLKEFAEALDVLKGMSDGPLKQLLQVESYRGLGEFDEAQRVLDRLAATEPQHQGVLLLGAILAIGRGDGQAAVPGLKKLLEQDPHHYVARHQLSLAYQSLGDSAAGKAESERMLESKKLHQRHDELYSQVIDRPSDADVRLDLARVCEQLGRTDEAAHWRQAAEQTRQGALQDLHSP